MTMNSDVIDTYSNTITHVIGAELCQQVIKNEHNYTEILNLYECS